MNINKLLFKYAPEILCFTDIEIEQLLSNLPYDKEKAFPILYEPYITLFVSDKTIKINRTITIFGNMKYVKSIVYKIKHGETFESIVHEARREYQHSVALIHYTLRSSNVKNSLFFMKGKRTVYYKMIPKYDPDVFAKNFPNTKHETIYREATLDSGQSINANAYPAFFIHAVTHEEYLDNVCEW